VPHPTLRTAGIAVGLLCSAGRAHATGTLEIVGAPASANGLSARVLARHAEAAFYNPALLPSAEDSTELSYFVLHTHGDIQLQARPQGVDVPESVYDARLPNPDGTTRGLELRPLPTAAVPRSRGDTRMRETTSYAVVGVVRRLFDDRLCFGFYGVLPVHGIQRQETFFSDERQQYFDNRLHFELLGDRGLLSSFSVALGSRPWEWLALGAGLNITTRTATRTWVYVPDAGDQRQILINTDINVQTQYTPYFGVATHPSRQVRLTTTLHFPSSTETQGENRVRFWTDDLYEADETYVRQSFDLSQSYLPLRFGVGAAWLSPVRVGTSREWELAVGGVLHRWSKYRDRHGEAPLDRWQNTVSVNLGAARTWAKAGRWAADLAYFPSPVPDQTGRANYVDNSRVAGGLGFEIPVWLLGTRLEIGTTLHGQILLARETTKRNDAPNPVIDEYDDRAVDVVARERMNDAAGLQTNNPGYPGFSSQGWMLGASATVRLPL
jgi:long-chain fatty acid transport protein